MEFDHSRTGVIIGDIALWRKKPQAITAEILGRKFEEQMLSSVASIHKGKRHPPNPSAEPLCGRHGWNDRQSLWIRRWKFTVDACRLSVCLAEICDERLQTGRADVMLTGGASLAGQRDPRGLFATARAFSDWNLRAFLMNGAMGWLLAKGPEFCAKTSGRCPAR